MKFNLLFWTHAFVALNYAISANILGVFPAAGISHYILASKLMKGLIRAGHDVTMISPYEMKDVPKNGSYTGIVLEELAEDFQRHSQQIFQSEASLASIKLARDMFSNMSIKTLQHPNFKQLLLSKHKFEVVIVEQMYNDALKIVSYLFDCPLIVLSSLGPNAMVNSIVGNPQPISYVPHTLNGDFSKNLTFVNRATNALYYLVDYFVTNYFIFPNQEDILRQAVPTSPPLYDLYTNVSLVLLNSHTSLYPALPIVPNMVEIGGYFIDSPKKLPQDLQFFLDNATDGAIYFSMGSNLKSRNMPKEKKELILNVFKKLKEKVLWKFEEALPRKPENVMISNWLPQQDILAHPKIKLFVTHGGLLSTTEAIYHGVPILAIPVFGDQNANADRAVSGGFGLKLAYDDPDFNEVTFGNLINELLNNPEYRINANIRSKIYHDRLMTPMETAVYWVEYVIRHKGAPHLRVAGVRLPWYKYFLIDVFVVVGLSILIITVILITAVKRVFSTFTKVTKNQKIN